MVPWANVWVNYMKNITLAAKIKQMKTDFFTSIHSSDETLYSILEQITVTMNDFPVIRDPCMRKGFWDRQGANIASR